MIQRQVGLALACMGCLGIGYYLLAPRVWVNAQEAVQVNIKHADPDARAETDFQGKISPLLRTYCYQCHGDGQETGGLALDAYPTANSIFHDAKKWDTLYRYVRMHQMPPSTEPQPTDIERKEITDWVIGQLDHYYTQHPNPGRVTIHRLNKAEYNNSIRDLVGLDIHPADDFPTDDSGYGFDNIADVLSLPPMLLEKYMASADKVMDQAIVTEPVKSHVNRVPASLSEISFYASGERGDGWVRLNSGSGGSGSESYSAVDMAVPQAGEYIIRVLAFGQRTTERDAFASAQSKIFGDGPLIASIQVGNTIIRNVEITEDEAHPQVYEGRMVVSAGQQRFQVVIHKYRGGANEDVVLQFSNNKKFGREQPGTVLIKYIEIEGPLPCAARVYSGAQLKSTGLGYDTPTGAHVLTSTGDVSQPIELTSSGDLCFRVKAVASRSGDEPAQMEMRVDGRPIERFNVFAPANRVPALAGAAVGAMPGGTAAETTLPVLQTDQNHQNVEQPQMYEARARLSPGKHVLSAAFVNPYNDPTNPDPDLQERTLTIESMQVVDGSNPPVRPAMPAPLRDLFAAHGVPESENSATETNAFADFQSPKAMEAARGIVADFARRAWRKPAPAGELNHLMELYRLAAENGETFEGSVKLALKTVLISPRFLFRGVPEIDNGNLPALHPINEFALAARLSYFLWSTTPDDELLDLAQRGELRKNLNAQIKRMLASPRAEALVQNFGGQWLQFRTLDAVQPANTFAHFDQSLRAAAQKEPELFFDYVMRQDRSIIDFVNSDYTFANERLAQFYGIPNVTGDGFQKVSLQGIQRRGILTQAGLLTLTSNPTRTSPVKRGKWVLENVLGAPPPPPPPNVPALDNEQHPLRGSLRQQMEQHRADPLCSSCHTMMDPIGFGLENFDAIGEYRATDSGGNTQIDASGKLATGETFVGPVELARILATSRRDDFVNCLAEKMMTYALGRGVEYYDRAAVDEVDNQVEKGGYRFSSLIQAVVDSVPFQMENTEAAATASK